MKYGVNFIVMLYLYIVIVFFSLGCSKIVSLDEKTNAVTNEEEADIVYVSSDGNDEWVGSREKPVRTIEKAIEIAIANDKKEIRIKGDIVYLYNVGDSITIPSRIKIKGGFNEDFSRQEGYTTLKNATVRINSSSWVEVSGILVGGAKYGGIVVQNSQNVVISNVVIANSENLVTSLGGGGVCISDSKNIVVHKVIITNGYANNDGGGILIKFSTNVVVSESFISNCFSDYNQDGEGSGGGIAVVFSDAIVEKTKLFYCGRYYPFSGNDNVIYLYDSKVKIISNEIIGVDEFNSVGLYEGSSITNHSVIGNRFISNMWCLYYDYESSSYIFDINDLNIPYKIGASEAYGNTVN